MTLKIFNSEDLNVHETTFRVFLFQVVFEEPFFSLPQDNAALIFIDQGVDPETLEPISLIERYKAPL